MTSPSELPLKGQPEGTVKSLSIAEEAKRSLAIAERIMKMHKPPLWKRARIGFNADEIIKLLGAILPKPKDRLEALLQAREDLCLSVQHKPEGGFIWGSGRKLYNDLMDKLSPQVLNELLKDTWDIHRDAVKFDRAIDATKKMAEMQKEVNSGKKQNLTVSNSTPPFSAAGFASVFGISRATVSNPQRPFGKFFKQCCQDQDTKHPRLPYKELFPLARMACMRSKSFDAGDINLKSVEDVKNLFIEE